MEPGGFGDQAVHGLWAAGALVLVGSALLTRRLPMKQSIKMALAWIAIFLLIYLGFLLWTRWR